MQFQVLAETFPGFSPEEHRPVFHLLFSVKMLHLMIRGAPQGSILGAQLYFLVQSESECIFLKLFPKGKFLSLQAFKKEKKKSETEENKIP